MENLGVLPLFAVFWLPLSCHAMGTAWVQGDATIDSVIPGTSRSTINWTVYAQEFNISPVRKGSAANSSPPGVLSAEKTDLL